MVRVLASISEILSKYGKVFNGIGQFKTELKIQLQENAEPFSLSTPRGVAIPLRSKLKCELDKLCKQNIIVPVDFPTDWWCSPIVIVPKKNGDEIRLCGDYTRLNNSVKRPIFPVSKIDVSLANIKGAKIFSKLDANAGYHQIKLDKESQPLTTFLTPFGRYMYVRLPFGINCSGNYFSKKFYELFSDLPNIILHIDDLLIHASSQEEHDKTLDVVLERLQNEGVTLNKNKCSFSVREVEFLGHLISENGINILPRHVEAITEAPTPSDKNMLLKFLGVITFVGKFIPNKSQVLEPLNLLLKDDIAYVWLELQKRAFEQIKKLVKQAPSLAHFDYNKIIIVQADASSYGLGAALMQEDVKNAREIVAYAYRTLTACEQKYSQIEKEALALAFGAERFKDFITGISITFETDHKPLLQILQTKYVDELTPRLQRIRMRLMRYHYKVVYIPGQQLVLADYLSRNSLSKTEDNADDLPEEINVYVNFVTNNLPASHNYLIRLKSEQESDPICLSLKEYATNE